MKQGCPWRWNRGVAWWSHTNSHRGERHTLSLACSWYLRIFGIFTFLFSTSISTLVTKMDLSWEVLFRGMFLSGGWSPPTIRGSGLWAKEGVELDVPLGVEDTEASGVGWVDVLEVCFLQVHVHSTHFPILLMILAIRISKISTLSSNYSEMMGVGLILVR